MELMEEEDAFDVFGYFKKLRQSRKGLIENLDQYKFVYDTLEEFVSCGNSWFPVKELSARLKQKSIKNPLTKINEYQHEYQLICKQTPRFTIGDCAGGHRADNREKNRDVLIVPLVARYRPTCTQRGSKHSTTLILSPKHTDLDIPPARKVHWSHRARLSTGCELYKRYAILSGIDVQA
ncbi:unnamed protein product, partial [Timema podura]|nr:unnamed protein product [Timema podura]